MATPTNQAAWIDKENSKPLRIAPSDFPVPGDNDIVVKNHAIAVNPVDWKIQDWKLFFQVWPNVLGADVAGEVVETGKNVTKFKKGDRVMGHALSLGTQKPQDGGFQLYTNILSAVAAKIPDSLSFTKAAVLPLAINTAGHGLYSTKEGFFGFPLPSLDPKPLGKTIVIWGGSSSVGALAIQLATASGAKVVSIASKRNHAFVKSLGASEVLDYNDPSIVDDVVKAVKAVGGEYAGIYDAISTPDSFKHVVPLAEKFGGGIVATTLPPPTDAPASITFGNVFAIDESTHALWQTFVPQALEQGKLKAVPEPLVVGKGLESIQAGLEKSKEGVSAQKVMVEL